MNMVPQFDRVAEAPTHQAPSADQGGVAIDLRAQVEMLRRRLPLIGPVAAVIVALVFSLALFETRLYTATASVMINTRQERVVEGDEVLGGLTAETGVIESEIEVIRSSLLLGRVSDDLKLTENPLWNPKLQPPSLAGQIGGVLLAPLALFRGGSDEATAEEDPVRRAVVDRLQRSVKAGRKRLSYVIEISVTTPDAVESARVANAIVEAYLNSQLEARFDAAQRANEWLGERLATLRQEVGAKERAAERFRAENGLGSADSASLSEQQATDLQGQIIAARADLAEKEARYRQVRELVARGGSAATVANALSSPVISSLRQQEAEVARRQADLESRYGELHPDVQKVRLERADVRAQIEAEVQRIATNLDNEVEVARSRLSTLEDGARGVRGQMVSNSQALAKLRELERDASASRAVLESFLSRFQEVANVGGLGAPDARLVSQAQAPRKPSSPRLEIAFAIALLLGAIGGVGLAYLLEALDDSISSAEDIGRKLNAPALAAIPVVGKLDLKNVAPERADPSAYLIDKPMSPYAESLRALRATLFYSDLDRRPRVVAVTSAMPGEGKTTTSMSLARVAAASGQRVLLIDCDLRRHSLDRYLPTKPTIGVLQVLAGEAPWRAALIHDAEGGVDILPATSSSFTPRDVFGSEAMGRLLDEVRAAYDLVICDCAPALAVAETRILARRADMTVLVVRWIKTPARAARVTLRQLTDAGAVVAGVALNSVDMRSARAGYYDAPYYSKQYAQYYTS